MQPLSDTLHIYFIRNVYNILLRVSLTLCKSKCFICTLYNSANEPAFYCIPAKAWEDLMDKLEDLELSKIAEQRMDEPTVKVTLDDL